VGAVAFAAAAAAEYAGAESCADAAIGASGACDGNGRGDADAVPTISPLDGHVRRRMRRSRSCTHAEDTKAEPQREGVTGLRRMFWDFWAVSAAYGATVV
jgi:hypothetical protein